MPGLVIVDACGGNLRSVARALAAAGGAPIVSQDPDVVRGADRVVIPGQGAFAPFMRGLAERGLGDALRDVLAGGTPMLGICLGLQVLFERSAEVEGHTATAGAGLAGLGLIAGTVELLRPTCHSAKVPRCLAKDPTDRFASMDDLGEALAAAQATLDVPVPPRDGAATSRMASTTPHVE